MAPLEELQAFHQFLGRKLQERGGEAISPEEAVELWRFEHPSPEDHARSVAEIREALDDMEAGDAGRPAGEVLAEIRRKYNLPDVS